jgi:hypothetical protein
MLLARSELQARESVQQPNLPEPIRRIKGTDSQLAHSPHLLQLYG